MDIKLIGLDLDDTTLTTKKEFTPHTKEVLEECLRRGIQVLPATGRVKAAIPDYLRSIEGLRYVLTSNGAAVIDLAEDKMIYQNGIAWDRALEIFDFLEKYHTFYDAYIDGMGWCEGRFFDHLDRFNIPSNTMGVVKMSRTKVENLRAFVREQKKPVEKINMFFAVEEERQQAFRELRQISDIAVTCSLANNIEINNKTCNKGDALLRLGEILNLKPEQIMACGDGNNDIEMIDMAGMGVAMENAVDELKKVANFVTKTCDEEGVAYAIEKFALSK